MPAGSSPAAGEVRETAAHILRCMEIWSGNRSVENAVSSPGLEIWISSQTYRGEARGGDVHYLSLCAGGVVTRLALADISGHGTAVADTSQMLRALLRRFMNAKTQGRLVRELNREFTDLEQRGRFATALALTWLNHRRRLLVTNAGHPRPLLYQRQRDTWTFLGGASAGADNFPLGIDAASSYQHTELSLEPGDCIVLYTDGLTEAIDSSGRMLGETGLLRTVSALSVAPEPATFGRQLMSAVSNAVDGPCFSDDATVMVLQVHAESRIPGTLERLQGYGQILKNLVPEKLPFLK